MSCSAQDISKMPLFLFICSQKCYFKIYCSVIYLDKVYMSLVIQKPPRWFFFHLYFILIVVSVFFFFHHPKHFVRSLLKKALCQKIGG